MKIVGLIAEYNPFHNGHLYHIQEAKRVTGADEAIVIMSGDYVQRGVPAIMPKRLRAEMALKAGAAAVFELPVCYATASAELFAAGAVSFLDRLGIVDSLCFGSECNNIRVLNSIADILVHEPHEYRELLHDGLKKGCTYPAARQKALSGYLCSEQDASVIRDPNNILGIEYLKALRKLGSSIRPFTIPREGSGYHDNSLSDDHFSSASAIRALLAYSSSSLSTEHTGGTFENPPEDGMLNELEDQVPPECLELLRDYHRILYPVYENDFSLILKYKLLNKRAPGLMRYADVSQELAGRISSQLDNYFNYKQFSELLKTKEVTQTRINRALLHIMLGIKKENMEEYISEGYHFYAHLLGIRKSCGKILTLISKNSCLPLIARNADMALLQKTGRKMMQNDILASNLYMSVVTDKYKTSFRNEYRQAVIKI